MKRRVLLVDLDPQGNATMGAGVDKRALRAHRLPRAARRERASPTCASRSPTGGFDLVPANRELAGAEVELVELPEREMRLKDALAEALRRCARRSSRSRRLRFHPARLPAVALAADAERPVRRGQRADPDAVRVLRARRPVRSGADDQEGARAPEPALEIEGLLRTMYDPRNTLAQQRRRRAREALRRQALPHGRCRATCASPRRRRTAFRRCISTRRRRARRPISRSPARCCGGWKRSAVATAPRPDGDGRHDDDPTQGTRPRPRCAARRHRRSRRRASRCRRSRSIALRPGKYQPRTRMDEASLARARRNRSSAQGVMQPILVRPVDGGRYEIIAGERRWRAAQRAGLEARCRRWCATCRIKSALALGADREHPARGSESARGGARPRAPDRRIRTDARRGGERGRPLAQRGDATCCACASSRKPVQEYLLAGKLDMGHARALLALAGGAADGGRGARRRAGTVGARNRAARRIISRTPARRGTKRGARGRSIPMSRDLAETLGASARRQGCDRGEARRQRPPGDSYSSLDQLDGILARLK